MRLLHNHKGDEGTQTMCRLRVGSFAVSLIIAISTLYSAVMWPPSTRQFLCTYPSNTSTDPLRTVKRMSKVRLEVGSQDCSRGLHDRIQSEFQGRLIGKA